MLKNGEISVSNCCRKGYLTVTDGEGTSYYECFECDKPCDVIGENEFKNSSQHLKKLDGTVLSDNGIGQKLVSLTNFKPQSGFPHYRRGGLFKWFKFETYGWEDKGKCGRRPYIDVTYYKICSVCYTELHIGRENNQSFKFCPKCLTKIKE